MQLLPAGSAHTVEITVLKGRSVIYTTKHPSGAATKPSIIGSQNTPKEMLKLLERETILAWKIVMLIVRRSSKRWKI